MIRSPHKPCGIESSPEDVQTKHFFLYNLRQRQARAVHAICANSERLLIEQYFTSREIDTGEGCGFAFHPMTGESFQRYEDASLHPVTGGMRIKKVCGVGWGSTAYDLVEVLRIGDGKQHTLKELKQGLSHWLYDPYTGKRL